MNIHHLFIFQPGIWIGEGKITLSTSPEFIKFYTKWEIQETTRSQFKAIQTVEMQGVEEHVINTFSFYDISTTHFTVLLENQMIGSVVGKGIIGEQTIAWEFRQSPTVFDGFEVYERQENGDYSLHAEYASNEQFKTLVEGLIWKKSL